MDDRRTNGGLVRDPRLFFPTGVDEITMRMAGAAFTRGRSAFRSLLDNLLRRVQSLKPCSLGRPARD